MRVRRVIASVCAASATCLLWTAVTWGAGNSATQPARLPAVVSDAPAHLASGSDTTVHASVPAPPPSPLDSEPIRHGADTGTVNTSISHSQGMELPRVAGALAIVITLIFLLRWGGKKLFNQGVSGRSTRAVQVLARSTISPRQHILLLRVGRRIIVVGESGAQMSPLSEITDANEIASLLGQLQDEKVRLPTKAFSALFNRARGEMGGDDEELASAEEQAETDVSRAVEEAQNDPDVAETRDEISGLMDKIRVLSKHFRSGPA